MVRWVLLIHELPDRSWHYDWMIQTDPVDRQAPLITFRVSASPIDPAVVAFRAERIADHRAAYLDYEGEVSEGRGMVRRVASGTAEMLRDDMDFVLSLDGGRTWLGRRESFESPRYAFRLPNQGDFGHTG